MCKPSVKRKVKIYQTGCILSKITTTRGKPFYKRCIIFGCRILGFKFFYNNLSKIVKVERVLGNTHKGCLMWPIYGVKEIVSADVFSKVIKVPFEGELFPAPIGYNEYLNSLYGDYELDPPLEKQKTHHNFNAYRL